MDEARIKEMVQARAMAASRRQARRAAASRRRRPVAARKPPRTIGRGGWAIPRQSSPRFPRGPISACGCGNPQAIAAMRPGEVVVDLGSGAGFDRFLAARQVRRQRPCHRRRHDP